MNTELEGKIVKIPGFIVPLDVAKDGTVSEFFLVPYFGACIHVPPPHPTIVTDDAQGLHWFHLRAYWITAP